jgi:hypothetical protein
VKIIYPGSRGPKPRYGKSQEAAITRSLCRYFRLVCGHHADMEVVLLYSCFPHERGTYYCESCSRWESRASTPAIIYPDEPLY